MSKKRQALDPDNPVVKKLGINALFQDLDDKNKKSPAVPKWAIKGKHGVYTTPPLLGQYILDNNRFIYFQHGKSIDLYSYDSKLGLWQLITKQQIDKQVTNQLNLINDWSSRKMHDTTTFVLSSINTLNASYTIDDVVDVDKVHFKNGVYSFIEDKMLPHSPNYYFSRGRNYSLKPTEQPTPNTDQWLIESVGEDGYTLLMQYIGYLFYRSNETWQAFIILLANGGDGKSTFFNWLDELIGDDNTSTVSLENLAIDNNKFALSRLVGMSLNYDADITNALIKKPDKLKKISGNDRIDVEEKGKDAFKVKLFTKLMFAANDLPAFKDNSGGFKRRAIIIPFNKIPNFRERFNLKAIYREIPKFAYKCMRAFWEARDQEYIKTSPAMDKLSDEWSGANNHVIEFVDDYCTIEEDAREKKVYVYKAYRSFCLASGYKPLSSVQFRKELERLDTKPKIYDTTAKINGKAYKSYINLKLREATVTKLLDSYR